MARYQFMLLCLVVSLSHAPARLPVPEAVVSGSSHHQLNPCSGCRLSDTHLATYRNLCTGCHSWRDAAPLWLRGGGAPSSVSQDPDDLGSEPVVLPRQALQELANTQGFETDMLRNFNASDEKEVMRMQLLLAQAEISRLKTKITKLENPGVLYFVEGVHLDLPVSTLHGWTQYVRMPYREPITTEEIFGEELGQFVLMGAKHVNSTNLAVAAMGRRKQAFKLSADEKDFHFENGVYWYRFWNTIGFSDTPNIVLNDCDTAEPDNDKKVSWFVDCGAWGGYRAGSHLDLYQTTKWERVLYYA